MTSVIHNNSLPITGSSRQSPVEIVRENPRECVSTAFLLAGGVTAIVTGRTLANVVAREILGLCNPLMLGTGESYYPCAHIWKKTPLYESASLALISTGFALSYGPAIFEKIKSLPLFGKIKNSSEIEPKGRDIDLLDPIAHLAAIITAISGGVALGPFMGSLFTFSELAVRQLSGTCTSEVVLESITQQSIGISSHDYCKSLIKNGSAELLAAGLALTAFGASCASLALIGRVRRLTNKN